MHGDIWYKFCDECYEWWLEYLCFCHVISDGLGMCCWFMVEAF